jgi:hypothetical protein
MKMKQSKKFPTASDHDEAAYSLLPSESPASWRCRPPDYFSHGAHNSNSLQDVQHTTSFEIQNAAFEERLTGSLVCSIYEKHSSESMLLSSLFWSPPLYARNKKQLLWGLILDQ